MSLFVLGDFKMHSGSTGRWKIECDSLSDADMECLAAMLAERLPTFGAVEGVPTGGNRIAEAMRPHARISDVTLIVDDVLTTGASMEEQRNGRDCIGAVLFARGSCPSWITPLFQLGPTEAG